MVRGRRQWHDLPIEFNEDVLNASKVTKGGQKHMMVIS
jgi:hypothetical protein